MRRETSSERDAWTAHVEGSQVARPNKYGNVRAGKYSSLHEAAVASNLYALQVSGKIFLLNEQVSYTLVEGRGKIRPIKYIADFTYMDDRGKVHVCDAKGYSKDKVYRLKKKLLKLLHGIDIEEL
jgi:hypothetical protein